MTLILVSTSPRRYQIFSLLNLPFLMLSPDGAEVADDGRSPTEEARFQARRKATSVAHQFPKAILIGSDTLISLDGVTIGKPTDVADARAILRRLRGRSHDVVTAVALVRGERMIETLETACVTMHDFSDTELDTYLATGDSLDKAGAYSVQGPWQHIIAELEGDYLAVMGLPLRAVAEGLRELGYPVAVDVEGMCRERTVLNWWRCD